ncbi:hypothetical protein [Epilithonimonas mollis]|uniref:Uncharacterized protein n=1 Tax=Epilithonimonas mollis TaxID=216903 RepID=A0A1M6NDH9_9FLAO|nr:hypothetical protein [Epilithonimonas mollis]SHJ93674.1 hypothetical protein SAMN05444371_0355 [Epilithonimonas mollis]
MARLKKNGNLSGAIGNIVFVNDGKRSYVRSKPDTVKQTKNTIASASVFGWVSAQEKQFRLILQDKIGLIPQQYFAARHVARLRKTVIREEGSSGNTIAKFQDPTALIGFDLNPKQEWERCTNFFPAFETDEKNVFTAKIPALSWIKQVKPPQYASLATINIHAIATDLNQISVTAELLSSLSMTMKEREIIPSQEWSFSIPETTKWLLVIAIINFHSDKNQLGKTERTIGNYLWAKKITD